MAEAIRSVEPNADIFVFSQTVDVLETAQKEQPEVAFISMEQEDGKGYFLVKKFAKMSPKMNVIAVAKEYRFAQELMRLRVSGYVTGDLTPELVRDEMANLRYSQNVYG